jgi:hypothetical protein
VWSVIGSRILSNARITDTGPDRCRKRKIRCIQGPDTATCQSCSRFRRECWFPVKRHTRLPVRQSTRGSFGHNIDALVTPEDPLPGHDGTPPPASSRDFAPCIPNGDGISCPRLQPGFLSADNGHPEFDSPAFGLQSQAESSIIANQPQEHFQESSLDDWINNMTIFDGGLALVTESKAASVQV